MPRLPATPARVRVRVTGSIPPGTVFSIEAVLEGHEFTGTQRWNAADGEMELTLTCSDVGRVGNGLSSMDEWSIEPAWLATGTSVVLSEPSAGGQEAEDDDALAQRIADTLTARVAPGTAEWYRAAMLEVDGVVDAAAYPNSQGGVDLVHIGEADLASWTARFHHAQDMLLGDVTTRIEAQVLDQTITFSCALPGDIVHLEAAKPLNVCVKRLGPTQMRMRRSECTFNPVEG